MENTHVLTLIGPQVSKKNNLRPRKGGFYYPREVRAKIDSYYWQALALWRDKGDPRPPLRKLRYKMDIYNQRADPDGIKTTVLDCLKRAGVIVDDSGEHCIGEKGGDWLVDANGPRVVVTLESVDA